MLENVPAAIGQALSSIRPGLGKLSYARDELAAPETLAVTSDAFAHEGAIPPRFTADGAQVSPSLRFGNVPVGTRSLALIVEDADSPTPSPLCHALAWGIEGRDGGFHEAALDADAPAPARRGAGYGRNSFMKAGWLPPDPPRGHGAHRYCFQLFALKAVPALEEGAGRGAVVKALAEAGVLARGMLVGTYERPA